MASSKPCKPHALVIPYPGQGHTTPMMQLSKKLAYHGFAITFVNCELFHDGVLSSYRKSSATFSEELQLDIRLESVPLPGLHAADGVRGIELRQWTEATDKMGGHVGQLMERLARERSSCPITCIISDALTSTWTQDLADTHHIPRIAFFTCSQSLYMFFFDLPLFRAREQLAFADHRTTLTDSTAALADGSSTNFATDADAMICGLPGLPPLWVRDIPTFNHNGTDATEHIYDYVFMQLLEVYRAERVLVNTVYELESSALDCLSSAVPTFAVGPLLPAAYSGTGTSKRSGTSFLQEQDNCLPWLDAQPAGSVVYISFGSMAQLSRTQFQEIAFGLQASQQRFLWVLRPDLITDDEPGDPSKHLPAEFLASCTKDKACMVSWAPQLEVLSHAAVGLFFTHCGWNSILESIANGVPMMGWPCMGDQMLNCRLMVQEWGVGTEVKRLERDEVEKVLRAMMEGEESQVLRKRVSFLKILAHLNILEGGHSFNNIQAFVQHMWSFLP